MASKFGLGSLLVSISLVVAAAVPETANGPTITKDVVIVGGGASGAYAAVRLREDFGKSILLVEANDHLVREEPANTKKLGEMKKRGISKTRAL